MKSTICTLLWSRSNWTYINSSSATNICILKTRTFKWIFDSNISIKKTQHCIKSTTNCCTQTRNHNLRPIVKPLILIVMDVDNIHLPPSLMNNNHSIIVNLPCLAQHRTCSHLHSKKRFIHQNMLPKQLHNSSHIPVDLIIHHLPFFSFHNSQNNQHQICTFVSICHPNFSTSTYSSTAISRYSLSSTATHTLYYESITDA